MTTYIVVDILNVQSKIQPHPISIFFSFTLTIDVTFSPYFTFTPPYFHYDYLIPLVQGHMAIRSLYPDSFLYL